ncbi:hypothetical protein MYA98_01675 [Salmonella sp. WGH-01]|nr:hypothetical protein MYA98_01675 [Salmonella sp. WGH-01]
MLLFPPAFSPRTPWPVAGLARVRRAKGQASSLYLFSYYLGSSIAGTLGGVFWHSYGWNGVGGFIALMLVLAIWSGRGYIIVFTPEKK